MTAGEESSMNVDLVNNILQMLVFIAIFMLMNTVKDFPLEVYVKFFSMLKEFNNMSFCKFLCHKLKGIIIQYLLLVTAITTFLWVVSLTDSFIVINLAIIAYIILQTMIAPIFIQPCVMK